MYDVVTIGSGLRDITFSVERAKIIYRPQNPLYKKFITFPLGTKNDFQRPIFTVGGGACNTAASFSKLGLKVAAITKIGKDPEGRLILEKLRKDKIDTRFIQIDEKLATGLSFIISPKKLKRERTIFTYRGAINNLKLQISDLKFKTRWIYLAGLTGPYWRGNLKRIFGLKSRIQNLKIAWNPGGAQLKAGEKSLNKYLKLTDVLIVNQEEAKDLIRKKRARMSALLKTLHKGGPKIVVITCGRHGAYTYDGKKIYYRQATGHRVQDATGAGDAAGAGFVTGLILSRGNVAKALKLAIFNSGSVVTEVGAQNGLLTRKEANKLIKAN